MSRSLVFALATTVLALTLSAPPAQAQDFILTDLSDPVLKDLEHDIDDGVTVNEPVAISAIVVNGEVFAKQVTVVIETRDSNGFTVDVQLQNGTVFGESYAEFSTLWRPQEAGMYELRAYVISNTQPLTGVKTSQVEISN